MDGNAKVPRSRAIDTCLDVAGYVAVTGVCLAIFGWMYGAWRFDLKRVWDYGDYFFTAFQFQSMFESGWYTHHPRIGMPLGTNLHDFPFADAWHFLVIRAIACFVPLDAFQALNLHLILTFPLAALTSYFALRRLGCGRIVGLALAQVYAFPYFHAFRLPHAFLAAYYLLPLMTLVLIRLASEPGLLILRNPETGRWKVDVSWASFGAVVVAVLIGIGGVYYAYFSCFFLAVLALLSAVGQRRWHAMTSCVLVAGVVCASALANLWPSIQHQRDYQPNLALKRVDPHSADFLGLRMSEMLIPAPGHPFSAWASRQVRHYTYTPVITETVTATLGAVGVLGFVWLLLLAGTRRPLTDRPADEMALANLTVAGVLLGVSGGIGPVIALFGFPEIRAYNRISIYLFFFAVTAVGLGLSRLARVLDKSRVATFAFHAVILALIPLAIRDQNPGRYDNLQAKSEDVASDKEFIQKLESTLSTGAMVLQLPHAPFPEAGVIHRMSDYDHFRGPLYSKSLRWSYGAVRERSADLWLKKTGVLPLDELIQTAVSAGFEAIVIDRFGYPDSAVPMERELAWWLGAVPVESANRRFASFDLRKMRQWMESELTAEEWTASQDILLTTFDVQTRHCYPMEILGDESRRLAMKPHAEIHIVNEGVKAVPVRIEMQLASVAGTGTIHVKSGDSLQTVKVTPEPSGFIGFEAVAAPGTHTIRLTSDLKGQPVRPNRIGYFRIVNLRVTPTLSSVEGTTVSRR